MNVSTSKIHQRGFLPRILTKNGLHFLQRRENEASSFLPIFYHILTFINIFVRTELPWVPTYTKPFRIPGLRLPPTMKAETITAPAARRVKMYLPPLPNAVDVRYPTTKKNSESNRTGLSMDSNETEDRKHASPTNVYPNPYPSPSTSRSNPLLISSAKRAHNYNPPRTVRVAPYRPPSPPTSDLPIPSDADISVKVDHEGIRLRYPGMKRLLRKVLCSYFFYTFLYLNATYLFCYLCLGSTDARALMCGTCWDLTVAVMCGKILRAMGKTNRWKFR
jgi:hypothetical protein